MKRQLGIVLLALVATLGFTGAASASAFGGFDDGFDDGVIAPFLDNTLFNKFFFNNRFFLNSFNRNRIQAANINQQNINSPGAVNNAKVLQVFAD